MKKWFLSIGVFLLSFHGVFSQEKLPRNPRYPVVLVQFRDLHFSLENPASLIGDMFSKRDFSYNGATGSVSDYYFDNLGGAFSPSFDVYGPVTLEGRLLDYGRDVYEHGERVGDKAPDEALLEACHLMDDAVDFSLYDADEDGKMDLILMVFAGYDQAEGASADALWSHQGSVAGTVLDGVEVAHYLAVSELSGTSGSRLSGIGPLCHELGHFLGLPDFYDTDFAAGGNAGGVYAFSLMGRGLYNNNGHTPPSLNAMEKSLIGLPDVTIPELGEGVVRLSPGQMAMSYTDTEGECFLYEYKSGEGWDAPLPRGLVIYHVDRSPREVGNHTAAELWLDWRNYNGVNALALHPCYYLVPPSKPFQLEYDAALVQGRMVFPGLDEVLFYEPVDWDGNYTGVQITNIALDEEGVSFRVLRDTGANINGTVRDSEGKPLEGVEVSLGEISARTGKDGFFLMDLPEGSSHFGITASKEGFQPYYEEVTMGDYRMKSLAVTLKPADAPRETVLSPYDTGASMGYFAKLAVLGGVRLSPEELYPYVGQELGQVVFYPYMGASFDGEVYLVVDVDKKRILTRKLEGLVKGPYLKQVVDLSGEHILIPEGVPMYIGYGCPSMDYMTDFRVGTIYPAQKGRSYYSAFSRIVSSWKDMFVESAGIYMDVALSVTAVENTAATDLVELGYSYIERPQGKLKAGDCVPLKVRTPQDVISVNWTLDGNVVSGESTPALGTGNHVLQAHVRRGEGIEEVLEVLLEVN